jgi:hypothetical protein
MSDYRLARPDKFSVLIVSPPSYAHSECFREVAETLNAGLIGLGYQSTVTDKIIPGTRTIVLGSNLLAAYPNYASLVPQGSIIYNLEQLENNQFWRSSQFFALVRRFTVWDYATENCSVFRKHGIAVQQILPISYHEVLSRIQRSALQDIDVLFIGSMNERRHAIMNRMRHAGLNAIALFGKYGKERDAYIARSKLLLNMHFHPAKILEQVRVSYYLANKIPVLSESSADKNTDSEWSRGVYFSEYENLTRSAILLCQDETQRSELGNRGFDFIKTRPITHHLRTALNGVENTKLAHASLRRNDPCFCGSGRRYKHCHGSFL